jgi:SAM-dependent MidA family methyltransferase
VNLLEERLRTTILKDGPMPFDDFMLQALYSPEVGYYAKNPSIGRDGDFYTSVSVGPLFGRLLAQQFFQMWQMLDRPDPFWIVEQGAHDGQLSRDVRGWCKTEAPEFFSALRYGIVDGNPVDDCVEMNLQRHPENHLVGVFFSNELVDAFPVHVVTFRDGTWQQGCAEVSNHGFVWRYRPLKEPVIERALKERAIPEIEGYTTELSTMATEWMGHVGRIMRRGYVLTIDYGFPSHLYYAPHRTAGTLTAYAKHKRVDDVLANVGEQDITAHVDFTALARTGQQAGLSHLGFVDQQRFLTGIAHDELAGAAGPRAGVAEHSRAFQTLTHPQHFGTRFHALLQAKDAPGGLDGLRFARAGDLF